MQNSISPLKSKRTIYSNCCVFPTDSKDQRSISKSGFFLEQSGRFVNQLKDRLTELKLSEDSSTQTSKTILELAKIESGSISPDSLNGSPRARSKTLQNTDTQTSREELSEGYASCENDKVFKFIDGRSSQPPPNSANTTLDGVLIEDEVSPTSALSFHANTDVSLSRHNQQPPTLQNIRERCCTSFVETCHPNFVQETRKIGSVTTSNLFERVEISKSANLSSVSTSPTSSTRGKTTYMVPTISSEKKNAQNEIKQLKKLFSMPKRDRSPSPTKSMPSKGSKSMPFVERKVSTGNYEAFNKHRKSLPPSKAGSIQREASIDGSSVDFFFNHEYIRRESEETSSVFCDNTMSTLLAKIKDQDWNTCIQGLAEIVDCCRMIDIDQIYPHMTTINQRLIELLRSPRSHVCRTACQAAGHLFELIRDTRRPEFDEVVDLLLFKTADANKFIRQDANLALDCMVTYIPIAHAIRALCSKGPSHKNHLVRTATVRLVVCSVVIAGPESVLNPNNSEHTRKRIFCHLPKFVEDKNSEVRKFGKRLYKVLSQEYRFDQYLKKYLDKEKILNMNKSIRSS